MKTPQQKTKPKPPHTEQENHWNINLWVKGIEKKITYLSKVILWQAACHKLYLQKHWVLLNYWIAYSFLSFMDHNSILFWWAWPSSFPKSHTLLLLKLIMGPHYFVKQIALNSVTEQVSYGCLTNLLSSPLCMGPQLKKGSLVLRWCKNYKINAKKTKRHPLFCICNMKTIPDEEDLSIHKFPSTSWEKSTRESKKNTLREKVYKVRKSS